MDVYCISQHYSGQPISIKFIALPLWLMVNRFHSMLVCAFGRHQVCSGPAQAQHALLQQHTRFISSVRVLKDVEGSHGVYGISVCWTPMVASRKRRHLGGEEDYEEVRSLLSYCLTKVSMLVIC